MNYDDSDELDSLEHLYQYLTEELHLPAKFVLATKPMANTLTLDLNNLHIDADIHYIHFTSPPYRLTRSLPTKRKFIQILEEAKTLPAWPPNIFHLTIRNHFHQLGALLEQYYYSKSERVVIPTCDYNIRIWLDSLQVRYNLDNSNEPFRVLGDLYDPDLTDQIESLVKSKTEKA